MERWLPIPGYEGLYEASDYGRIRSLPRNTTRGKILTRIVQYEKGRVVRCTVKLSKNGIKPVWAVHRLILLTFVGPCPEGMQGRHFPDPDPTNNRITNLSWSTSLVNQRDRDVHGTHNKGTNNVFAKLDDEAVRQIRMFTKWPYGLLTVLAEQYGVSPTTIKCARDRKSWRHVNAF